MANAGEGRTLVTDNWYTSQKLMMKLFKEFKMTMVETVNATSKKSRTANDFPFAKISPAAQKKIHCGWFRTAYQNVHFGKEKKPAFTMQAIIWKDKKLVGMLHNFGVQAVARGTHFVQRWSPKRKAKKEVESSSIVPVYCKHYNGVDRKDRDTADYTVSLESGRWYIADLLLYH